jgi:hypothetical protein
LLLAVFPKELVFNNQRYTFFSLAINCEKEYSMVKGKFNRRAFLKGLDLTSIGLLMFTRCTPQMSPGPEDENTHVPQEDEEFPFPYFGHGDTRCWDWMLIVVCFVNPPQDHSIIEKGIPNPLRLGSIAEIISRAFMKTWWDENFFALFNTVEVMSDAIDRHYFGNWNKFQKRIDKWLLEIHKQDPIQFASREWAEGEPSMWHAWSIDQLVERVLPPLIEYQQRNVEIGKFEDEYNPVQAMIQYDLLIYMESKLADIVSDPELTREVIELLEWLPHHPYNQDTMMRKAKLLEQLRGE